MRVRGSLRGVELELCLPQVEDATSLLLSPRRYGPHLATLPRPCRRRSFTISSPAMILASPDWRVMGDQDY